MGSVSHMTCLVALFALDAGKLTIKYRPLLITMKHTRPGNIIGWLPNLGLVTMFPSPYFFFLSHDTSSQPHCLACYTCETFLKNRTRPGQEEHSGENMVLEAGEPGFSISSYQQHCPGRPGTSLSLSLLRCKMEKVSLQGCREDLISWCVGMCSAQWPAQSRAVFFPHWVSSLILSPLNKAQLAESPHKVPRQPQGDQVTQGPVPTRKVKVQDVL